MVDITVNAYEFADLVAQAHPEIAVSVRCLVEKLEELEEKEQKVEDLQYSMDALGAEYEKRLRDAQSEIVSSPSAVVAVEELVRALLGESVFHPLNGPNQYRIPIIKSIRRATGMGLKEAKDLYDKIVGESMESNFRRCSEGDGKMGPIGGGTSGV